MLKVLNLFGRKEIVALFLFVLLAFQLIYSFRFPAVGDNANWLPITDYLPKFQVESTDNLLLKTFYPLISLKYRLNSDVGEYLIVARDFTPGYLEGHQYLNRPLYPFLIFATARAISPFINPSYGILFGLAIMINFMLIAATVFLFFNLLKSIFSLKIAFLSSLLLIFSPFVHSFITQPMPEMLTAFGVTLVLYLLYCYVQKSSITRLIIFSLLGGALMLGKLFFATPLLVLLLAVYYKRYREGMLFAVFFTIPVIAWYLWVTKIWGIPYYVHEVQHWKMGIWILSILQLPWQETLRIFTDAVPSFIKAVMHSFIFIPIIFAAIGVWSLKEKTKKVFCYSFITAVFLLTFLINLYLYRHTFLLFPIVYPATILGIESLAYYIAKYTKLPPLIFYATSIGLIILISSINIYKFYNYDYYS